MNNLPRQTLITLIAKHGPALSEDPRRVEAFLRDLCGQHKREIFVLVNALKCRVAADLLNSKGVPPELLLARLTQRLEDEMAVNTDAACWAVETWVVALGVWEHAPRPSPAPKSKPASTLKPVARPDPDSSIIVVESKIWPTDGKVMVRVPAGEFLYGDNKEKKFLPEFWIDQTPVTNAEYKRFLDAKSNHPVPLHRARWTDSYNWDQQKRTYPPNRADHPVVLVSWHDAAAYAKWAGKQLPTEKQWEKAARGTDGRAYPWGNKKPAGLLCNFKGDAGGTTPVGRYYPRGDSPYGCVDMAGNVWEWTESYWGNVRTRVRVVLRGGSWNDLDNVVRVTNRGGGNPTISYGNVGFRCVQQSFL